MTPSARRRRFRAPEVVQTSGMDCGPASLKCLLEGFGVPASYGRLREACQTDVDGTSIDTLEEVARALGLDAEQTMVPLDHLLLDEAEALPAIVVVTLPNGFTHFLVAWRKLGPWVELMDPAVGRRRISAGRFLDEVYLHEHRVPADAWREWAASEGFLRPLARRLAGLGIERRGQVLIAEAAAAPGWKPLAKLDAAARLASSLVESGGLRRGREARAVLDAFLDGEEIPAPCWSARAPPPGDETGNGMPDGSEGMEQVILRGAVILRVRGLLPASEAPPEKLGLELSAALAEPPARPGREILRLLRGDGAFSFAALAAALAVAACAAALEAVLLRGAIELGSDLGLITQRLAAAGAFIAFAICLLLVELRTSQALLRLGRRLEARLRLAFLEKIPRLNDRYFSSRPVSDMAERSHSIQRIRDLPRLAGQLVRAAMGLLVTAAGISLVDPRSAPLAFAAAACAVLLPLLFKPSLEERDLRVKTHGGALNRFYLDSLLGLAAARAHSSERALRREQESLLVEWARASRRLLASVLLLEGLQALAGYGLAFLIVYLYAARATDLTGALLLAYWGLLLPALGEEIALLVRQYPAHRNSTLRLLEPLGAPEERPERMAEAIEPETGGRAAGRTARRGISVRYESVVVRAAGHTILDGVDLAVECGEHVAVVGPSGSGKSTLVGLLLGWHRPLSGRVLVDGTPLHAKAVESLRRETAWVEPGVQLWNRSFLENLRYGSPGGDVDPSRLGRVLDDADLYGVLERLPGGMQTPLGEGGGLVSGGEGQRVRFGRGMFRPGTRLVILDEPFRGLDRRKRRELLERARRLWRDTTLICITHDVSETRGFGRVLVLDGGRVVEDGPPERLEGEAGSRYRSLLDAEEDVRVGLWSRGDWRRLALDAGALKEERAGGERP